MKIKELQNKKVAVYGGSFNPIHFGHLLTARDILEHFHYDYILFVPVNIPVHKDSSHFPSPLHRLKMTELAAETDPHFAVSSIEINRGGPSYTIDTIEELREQFHFKDKIGVIIGDDLLDGLPGWKRIDRLQEIADIICLRRIASPPVQNELKITFFQNRLFELSSTEIRNRIKNHSSIDFMLPHSVKDYIIANQLYRD